MDNKKTKIDLALINNIKDYVKTERLNTEKEMLFKSFLEKKFPTKKDEEWKYTSLKKIIDSDYNLISANKKLHSSKIEKTSLGFKHKVVFSDGKLIHAPKINGVSISDFSDFKALSNNSITELNAALAKNGFYISIEKNTIVKEPIEILFLNSTEDSFFQYRNQFIIGENSQIKIIEKIYDLTNTCSLVNNFTKITCNKNSVVEYNKIQNNTENARLLDTTHVFQEDNSTCKVNTLIFGGEFTRNNLEFEQNGSNCESNMNGISLLDGDQLADNHTFVDHKKAHCRSNEMYKGIYLGNAKGVFNGKIMVRKNAQKIDAFQSNNNLLLSDSSTIDSKPQLEIYADDVKCSHGCTIGQLDEEALFYMRSRGIANNEAKAVLTYAFAAEVIDDLSIHQLKKLVQKLLANKLNVKLDFSI